MGGAMVFALVLEMGAAALVTWTTWRAATGSLGRNPVAGARTRITMSSDAAWRTGHRAALRSTMIAGTIAVLYCALSIVLVPLRTPASVIVASVVLVGGSLLSITAAHRAVRRAASEGRY